MNRKLLSGVCEFMSELLLIIALGCFGSSTCIKLVIVSCIFMVTCMILRFKNPKKDSNLDK